MISYTTYLKKLNEKVTKPEDILISNGIKIKDVEMDDESYVIFLYKKDDIQKAKKILEKEGYKISVVGKLLYLS